MYQLNTLMCIFLTLVKVHPGKKYRTMVPDAAITRSRTDTAMVRAEGLKHDLPAKPEELFRLSLQRQIKTKLMGGYFLNKDLGLLYYYSCLNCLFLSSLLRNSYLSTYIFIFKTFKTVNYIDNRAVKIPINNYLHRSTLLPFNECFKNTSVILPWVFHDL